MAIVKIVAASTKKNKYYPLEGIYMGLVGARFEKPGIMEHSLMIITPEQNTTENGYGAYQEDHDDTKQNVNIEHNKVIWRAFESFYGRSYLPKYDEFVANTKSIENRYYKKKLWGNDNNCPYLDKEMYKQRIRISLELFLFDADYRAQEASKTKCTKGAFCYIVGLGTGVWSFKKSLQDELIVRVTLDIIKKTVLRNIECVYFAGWMMHTTRILIRTFAMAQDIKYASNLGKELLLINWKNHFKNA
eukprot:1034595_1